MIKRNSIKICLLQPYSQSSRTTLDQAGHVSIIIGGLLKYFENNCTCEIKLSVLNHSSLVVLKTVQFYHVNFFQMTDSTHYKACPARSNARFQQIAVNVHERIQSCTPYVLFVEAVFVLILIQVMKGHWNTQHTRTSFVLFLYRCVPCIFVYPFCESHTECLGAYAAEHFYNLYKNVYLHFFLHF